MLGPTDPAAAPVTTGQQSVESDQTTNTVTPPAVTPSTDAEIHPNRKSKQKSSRKSKARNSPMGFDGTWDDPGPSKSSAAEVKKSAPDPWDVPPIPNISAEDSGSKLWDTWDKFPPVEFNLKTGDTEATSANEGIRNPASENRKPGWQKIKSQGGTPKESSSGRADESPSKTGQQSPANIHLRGGGPDTQSITSHRSSGRHSPLVVNNSIVYNGGGSTPPPSNRPPPGARAFWQNMDAAQVAKNTLKADPKPGAAVDVWDNPPLPTNFSEPDSKDKVNDWNVGTNMPGGWDTVDKPQKGIGTWGNSSWPNSNENDKATNGSQQGETSGWDQPATSGSQNGGDWTSSDDRANNKTNDWNDSGKAGNETSNDWGNFNNQGDNITNDWDTAIAQDRQQISDWTNPVFGTASPPEDAQIPDRKNKPSRSPGSAKGSKAGSRRSNSPKPQTKTQPSIFTRLNPFSKNAPEASSSPAMGKKAASPGAWSPPIVKAKKEASPSGFASIAPSAGRKIPTPAQTSIPVPREPLVKPYWSSWRRSISQEEKPTENVGSGLAEAPIYTLSEDLIDRNKTTHQIRPNYPVQYSHKISRPRYMDSFEQPYAVFVFKYRDKETIESMLNGFVIEPEVDEKTRLSRLPKEQLVEEVLKAKSQAGSASRHSGDNMSFKSNPFGISTSPNASALTKKLHSLKNSRAPTPEKVGGWLQNADDNKNEHTGEGVTWAEHKDLENKNDGGGDDSWGGFNANNGWGKNDERTDEDSAGDAWDTNKDATSADEKKNDSTGNDWDNNDFNIGGDTWDTTNANDNQKDDTTAGDGWGFGNEEDKMASPNSNSDKTKVEDDWKFNKAASPSLSSSKKSRNATSNKGWDFKKKKASTSPPLKKADAGATSDWPNNNNDDAWATNDNNGNDWNTGGENNDDKKTEEDKKDDDWNTSGFGGIDTSW